jgi:hypothetical protein
MNPLSLTRMVDRMIMDCLVCHQAGMTDPRQVNLMLTDLRLKSTAWARTMTRQYPTCWEKEKCPMSTLRRSANVASCDIS